MPTSHALTVISPAQVLVTGDQNPYPLDWFDRRCLAQGDSWFSIGAIPPGRTSNILAEMSLAKSVVAVNCAHPGRTLSHMTDTSSEPQFLRLLTGTQARQWDALLLSGGGNDLIDAVGAGPAHPPEQRLLATAAERGADPATADYLSATGWDTFASHLRTVFDWLLAVRAGSINKDAPMFFHTYAYLQPRPAPAGPGFGPWLQPALDAFAVPAEQRAPISKLLIDRLADLLTSIVDAHPGAGLTLIDTRAAGLAPADEGSTGASGDYANEIHPSFGGYAKLATVWRAALDAAL